MPQRYQRRIFEHLADRRYEPQTVRMLAEALAPEPDDRKVLELSIKQLLSEGQLVLGPSDSVVLPPPGREIIGTFRKHERGFGFVIPEQLSSHGDLFIPPGQTGDALTGDKVRAKVLQKEDRGRRGAGKQSHTGKIVEILERSTRPYVGTLMRRGKLFMVETDGRALHDPVIIRDPGVKNANVGDKVVIEIVNYPEERGELPEGVITQVLGEAGEPDVETTGVMHAFGLPQEFPEAVTEEARRVTQSFDPDHIPGDREDLTREDLLICTIDPPDARDYDDAISIHRLDNGGYELGVHIADVAHFVKPGGALDNEAYERGNSTYLPRRVVPMLPEVLSNGVCSLQEGVNRYAKSCFIQYDGKGKVVSQRFARSVIRSVKRLTYLEAQALIDSDLREAKKHVGFGSEANYPTHLVKTIKLMDELAKVIRERRLKEGMIVLGLPDVELVFDDSGRVVDAHPEDDAFTHTIIEMFMVEANEAAARLFDRLDVPMIRRIHPDPDPHDMGDLGNYARVAGYNIPAKPSRQQLQALLDSVRGKPAQHAVHFAVLRTLTQAQYAPDLIGHFALASEHYTHFTSPIRRYPDLIVHRGLDAIIEASKAGGQWPEQRDVKRLGNTVRRDKRVPNEERLREIGKHCSSTERNSETAERELRTYLVLELLSEHLGEDFEGVVTGISTAGVFIELEKFLVDGFVEVGELPGAAGERWKMNTNAGNLVAQRSGRSISIGNRFTVRIARVELPRRRMELVIVEDESGNKPKKLKKRTQPNGARKALQGTQRLKTGRGRKQTDDKGKGKRRRGRR